LSFLKLCWHNFIKTSSSLLRSGSDMDDNTVSELAKNVADASSAIAEGAARSKGDVRPSDNLVDAVKVATTGVAAGSTAFATASAIVSASTVTLAPAGTVAFAGATFATAAKTAILAPAAVVAVASAGPIVAAAAGGAVVLGAWYAVKKIWG
jgi:hypothetical protein